MLDVSELEKKWSTYHFKKMLPRYIMTGTVLLASAVAGYIFVLPKVALSTPPTQVTAKKESSATKTDNTQNKQVVQIPSKTVVDPTVYTTQNILAPSFLFTASLDKDLLTYNNALVLASVTKREKTVVKPKKKKVKKISKKRTKKSVTKKRVKKKAPVKMAKPVVKKPPTKVVAKKSTHKSSIVLGETGHVKTKKSSDHAILQKKKTTDSELASVIKRFKRSKKPALGLFIANRYYVSGDYKSSYKYARATYKINPNIEDAVLLYAKSLAKLGHKDKAIARLKPYIKKSGSIEAKALLNNLNKGLFK